MDYWKRFSGSPGHFFYECPQRVILITPSGTESTVIQLMHSRGADVNLQTPKSKIKIDRVNERSILIIS
jgi:hypothetical protein